MHKETLWPVISRAGWGLQTHREAELRRGEPRCFDLGQAVTRPHPGDITHLVRELTIYTPKQYFHYCY